METLETPKFKTFGEWLFYWRKRIGYTQPEVADFVGRKAQQISNLERAEPDSRTGKPATPSIYVLAKLCKLFKRPISEPVALILGMKIDIPDPEIDLNQIDKASGGQETSDSPSQQIAKLRTLFLQLPPERRTLVVELVELFVAGVIATSFNRALDDALASPADELIEEEEMNLADFDEKGKKPA